MESYINYITCVISTFITSLRVCVVSIPRLAFSVLTIIIKLYAEDIQQSACECNNSLRVLLKLLRFAKVHTERLAAMSHCARCPYDGTRRYWHIRSDYTQFYLIWRYCRIISCKLLVLKPNHFVHLPIRYKLVLI